MKKPNVYMYEGDSIRTIEDENGEIWFVGVDVTEVLGYKSTSHALDKLDDDERKLDALRDHSGQKRKTWIVNESGLYSLILTSTKPEAKAFKRWVTHQVLPSIRKAGKYTSREQAEKDVNLRKLHNKIANLEVKRSEINTELKEVKQQFIDLLYTDPDQLSIPFNEE